ncbi:hypothetical protein [Anaerotignum sp. MSJ-24]|uniref:hypothetical protein n=1 Tax=Anaerotignum sp. MSJ-24 TaxID=2841521 RepID=UPI001C0F4A6D|nr:hypothetical protein [Anaerotignum sp. MSJ-24]MBU5463371.1 hypothetical protein [Anaerotignum sp. MSJ-24]
MESSERRSGEAMKIIRKRALALLLALVMPLPLCACAPKQQQNQSYKNELNTSKATLPSKTEETVITKDQTVQNGFSTEANKSLELLRDSIDFSMTMFGATYLGYVGGMFEEGFETGFPKWMSETNKAMLLKYPFIGEIDENHIIGRAGHLYCIVPVDENATISINRVKWNEKTKTDEVTEVLYRSESGEPVLLFANLDGVAYEDDTQVFITDNNGKTCEWHPSTGARGYLAPCISETGEYLLFDFTEYGWTNTPIEFSEWLADGWSGMTALGLAGSQSCGMTWVTESMVRETDRYAFFALTFYPGDETGGTVDLNWVYDNGDDFEEMWSGFWTIQTVMDGPSYVTLSLSLVGGKSYGVTDGPMYICETYPLMINPSGTGLVIGAGENGICLPFMSQSTMLSILTQSVG